MTTRQILIAITAGLLAIASLGCDQPTETPEGQTAAAEAPGEKEEGKEAPADGAAEKAEAKNELPFEAVGAVATIDGREVPAERFNEEVERMSKMVPHLPAQQIPVYKERVLDNVISKQLIDDAVAKGNVEVKDDAVNAEIDEFKKRIEEAGPGGLKVFMERTGTTEDELRDGIRDTLELKELLARDYDVKVTDAEAKKHYTDNISQFERPEQLRASHILWKLEPNADEAAVEEARKKAEAVAKEARQKDADFAALAKQHSQGPTGPNGGDLGEFPKGRMVPEFDEVAWKLKPGEVSDPVKTQFGWHVIKVTDRTEAGTVPFEEVKDMLVSMLERKKIEEAMTKFLDKQKAAAKIEKNEANIKDNPEYAKNQPPMMPHGMPPGMIPGGQGGQQQPMKLQLKQPN